jgi:hypothetical protein
MRRFESGSLRIKTLPFRVFDADGTFGPTAQLRP